MYYKELTPFSSTFLWGAASAAYQVEGGWNKEGKGPSIWDTYTAENTDKAKENGKMAVDHFHRFKEDVALMKQMKLRAYRFSVAWSRVIPDGEGSINEKGLGFYEELIDELIKNGIEPVLTLYHWDLPDALQKKYGGWESAKTVEAFTEYCHVLFERLGHKVTYWITMNEQNVFIPLGYRWAVHPPAVSDLKRMYQANHYVNLANAQAINLFHQLVPQGKIGPSFGYGPVYPLTSDPLDVLAAENAEAFNNDWWLSVYCLGEYPKSVLNQLKKMGIAPQITEQDQQLLKSARPDFLGINYYHGGTVQANQFEKGNKQQKEFSAVDPYLMQSEDGKDQAPETVMFTNVENPFLKKSDWGWEIDPVGFRIALRKIQKNYRLPIFVTENGLGAYDVLDEKEKVHDTYRIEYLKNHLIELQKAMTDGVEVIGYCAWSFTDLLSWLNGFQKRYGFVYVDQSEGENLRRIPKESFYWYKKVIETNGELLTK